MNKIIKIILLSLFLVSCSLNSDSSFWTKRNISEEQKIVNIKQITKKDEILIKEVNKSLEINLSNLKKENYPLSYFDNNNGRTNYKWKFEKYIKI